MNETYLEINLDNISNNIKEIKKNMIINIILVLLNLMHMAAVTTL